LQGVFGLDPSTVLPSMVPNGFYTSTVALSALVRVLTNPAAATHRKAGVQAIMKIIQNLGSSRSGQFLPHVVPHLLNVARTQLASKGTPEHRTWPIIEMGKLVQVVKGQFRAYLPPLFDLTRPYFDDYAVLPEILALTQSIAQSLESRSLQLYVPNLLPEMLGILRAERETTDVNWANTPAVLDTIATLGSNLSDYLYLVMPMLMRLIDHSITASGQVRIDVRVKAVWTLLALVKKCDVADYASRILHPIVRWVVLAARRGGWTCGEERKQC
jgi:FKBP12-rapamycin complex-associated protein